jgi:uncharacterized membrane protein YfcA
MISCYRELVTVFSILLSLVGSFLIYDSLADASPSDGLKVVFGACCCSLAIIMVYNLVVHLHGPTVAGRKKNEIREKV